MAERKTDREVQLEEENAQLRTALRMVAAFSSTAADFDESKQRRLGEPRQTGPLDRCLD